MDDRGEGAIGTSKSALTQAPAEGHSNYKLPFLSLFGHEGKGNTLAVLAQRPGDQH